MPSATTNSLSRLSMRKLSSLSLRLRPTSVPAQYLISMKGAQERDEGETNVGNARWGRGVTAPNIDG